MDLLFARNQRKWHLQKVLGGPEASNSRGESDLSWSHYANVYLAHDFGLLYVYKVHFVQNMFFVQNTLLMTSACFIYFVQNMYILCTEYLAHDLGLFYVLCTEYYKSTLHMTSGCSTDGKCPTSDMFRILLAQPNLAEC